MISTLVRHHPLYLRQLELILHLLYLVLLSLTRVNHLETQLTSHIGPSLGSPLIQKKELIWLFKICNPEGRGLLIRDNGLTLFILL
jgi:hypothetical protein